MTTRTINLTDEAYVRLKALKRGGESFSDVVNRLTGKHAIVELVGILDARGAAALRDARSDLGARLRKGIDRAAKRLA